MSNITPQGQQTTRPNLYQKEINNKNSWQNRLAAALMMNKANPQTMFGYLIGNAFLKKPFQDWLETTVFPPAETNDEPKGSKKGDSNYQFTKPDIQEIISRETTLNLEPLQQTISDSIRQNLTPAQQNFMDGYQLFAPSLQEAVQKAMPSWNDRPRDNFLNLPSLEQNESENPFGLNWREKLRAMGG